MFLNSQEKGKKEGGGGGYRHGITMKSQMWVQNEDNLHKPKDNVHGANCNKSDAQTKSYKTHSHDLSSLILGRSSPFSSL